MIRHILIAFCLVTTAWPASYWVAPNVASNGGSGTYVAPGALINAVEGTSWATSIAAGDTVFLRAGSYSNSILYPTLSYSQTVAFARSVWRMGYSGATNNPVTWKSATNEWAAIDGSWLFGGVSGAAFHRFRDLDFYQSAKANQTNVAGTFATNRLGLFSCDHPGGNEFINITVHDVGNIWDGSGPVTARGVISWFVGSTGLEHGMYASYHEYSGSIGLWTSGRAIQGAGGPITASNIFVSCGETVLYPTVMVSSGGGMFYYGNVMFDNQPGSGGSALSLGMAAGTVFIITNNFIAHIDTPFYIEDGDTATVTLRNNTVFSRSARMINRDDAQTGTWTVDLNRYFAPNGNVYFDAQGAKTFAQWQSTFGYDASGTSSNSLSPTNQVWVFPNADQAKRAHIAIYNSASNHNVTVSLAGVLSAGDTYHLYSAQNYLAGPIQTGTYNGTGISVPMTNLAVAPILYNYVKGSYSTLSNPAAMSPGFGAFVVRGEVTPFRATASGGAAFSGGATIQ